VNGAEIRVAKAVGQRAMGGGLGKKTGTKKIHSAKKDKPHRLLVQGNRTE